MVSINDKPVHSDTTDLWDVVAVNLQTHEHRIIASGKWEADAEAIVSMAIMRRGVDDEFFKVVPHGNTGGIEVTS